MIVPGGTWTDVPGTRAGVASAGIASPAGRADVAVLVAPGTAAAVTTRSTAAAAPCVWTRARVPAPIHAVVINAGNANAATGASGPAAVSATAARVAEELGCSSDEVLVCSTGVVGVPLPLGPLLEGVTVASRRLHADGHAAARAIMTTDTVPKSCLWRAAGLTVGGIAKGSGMIHPDMATMLGFVATDAAVVGPDLQALLVEVVERTFHAVTVDGDTSTNDTVVLQATGAGPALAPGDPGWADLARGVEAVCRHLARAIAADGEGATTLVEVVVRGLDTDVEARHAARAVARSPLVKTAVAGRDPNWGRIVGALGAAGAAGLDVLSLDVGGVPVMRDGAPVDAWDEAAASAALGAPEVTLAVTLPGPGRGVAWGCDLTADYVSINADYRS